MCTYGVGVGVRIGMCVGIGIGVHIGVRVGIGVGVQRGVCVEVGACRCTYRGVYRYRCV